MGSCEGQSGAGLLMGGTGHGTRSLEAELGHVRPFTVALVGSVGLAQVGVGAGHVEDVVDDLEQDAELLGGERDGTTLHHFRSFAAELGLLFQIVDDILDVTGNEVTLGKPQGSDERHGKLTYVSSYGLEGAREMARESHRSARAALASAAQTGTEELEQITDFIYTRTT